MSSGVIAIDIDDVLSSQTEVLISYSNEEYGTNLSMEDFKEPGEYWTYYEQVFLAQGINPKEAKRRFNEFLEKRIPLTQVIHKDTIEALRKLKKNFQLDIVTARGEDWYEETVEWVNRHAQDIFRDIHFVTIWSKDVEYTKGQICKEIGAGYLIDDNFNHCLLASNLGVSSLLFGEYGWNHGIAPEGVTRVKNWHEVLGYFDERS